MAIQSTSKLLPRLQAHLHAAEQLVVGAAGAVGTFYWDKSPEFIGFLRDSSAENVARHTTGGLRVAAALLQLAPEWEYLKVNLGGTPKLLEHARYCRNNFINEHTYLPAGFGLLNALTVSHCGFLALDSEPKGDVGKIRAGIFLTALVNLLQRSKGWPSLADAEEPHPAIAYYVTQAARRMLCNKQMKQSSEELLNYFANRCSKDIIYICNRKIEQEVLEDHLTELQSNAKDHINGCNWKEILRDGISGYAELAENYLWTQSGRAPRPDAPNFGSPHYDPVGACFALNILFDGSLQNRGPDGVVEFLGEHSSLVAKTTRHVIAEMTPSGHLAYGLPFVYNADRGSGAFATSVSGLAALAMFWSKCVAFARKQNYPSEALLREVLLDNSFENLFHVIPVLTGSRRSINANLNGESMKLEGWASDRSPSRNRVESWVSVDVLQFGVFVRDLIHELSQMLVLDDLGATLPTAAPKWPYDRRGDYLCSSDEDYYVDPDFGDRDDKGVLVKTPLKFLHDNLEKFIPEERGSEDHTDGGWKQTISSVILFGPPGTSKSTLVQSLACALRWHVVELNPGQFIVGGLERLEHHAATLFDQIGFLRESIILFDELDSIFVDRTRVQPGNVINFIVPAMLPKLQRLAHRLRTQRALLVIATNFYDRLDPALVRKGRVDSHILMLPYNSSAREQVLARACVRNKVQWECINEVEKEKIVEESALMTFEELQEVSREMQSELDTSNECRGPKPWIHRPAVNGLLYASRVDSLGKEPDALALERLAREMCGVTKRLLNQGRGSDEDLAALTKNAKELTCKLKREYSKDNEWVRVMERLVNKLGLLDTNVVDRN